MARTVEKVYVVCALVYMSSAFPLRDVGDDPTQSNLPMLLVQTIVYLVAMIYWVRWWPNVRDGLRKGKWVLLLSAFAVLSAGWSEAPLFTLKRGIVVLCTTIFGTYFAATFRRDDQVRLLCWAFGAMAVLSVLAAVLVPSYGVDHMLHEGDWQGVYSHKNILGRLMVPGALVFLLRPGRGAIARAVRISGFLLCVGVLFMSGSRTAWVLLLMLLVAIPIFRLIAGTSGRVVVPLATASLVVTLYGAWAVLDNYDALLGKMDRDVTLTGRTLIWASALEAIDNKPWLGHGYSAFWMGSLGPSKLIVADVGWEAPHAHNGYLDVCLDLGLLGLSIFLISMFGGIRSALKECQPRLTVTLWPILIVSMTLIYNLTETSLLKVNGLFWVLYVSALVRAGRAAGEAHDARKPRRLSWPGWARASGSRVAAR